MDCSLLAICAGQRDSKRTLPQVLRVYVNLRGAKNGFAGRECYEENLSRERTTVVTTLVKRKRLTLGSLLDLAKHGDGSTRNIGSRKGGEKWAIEFWLRICVDHQILFFRRD